MGVPPDNRNYGSAQLVLEFLRQENLEKGNQGDKLKVDKLFMQNRDKIIAVGQVVEFASLAKLPLNTSRLSREAKRTYDEKKAGKVKNGNGDSVKYKD